MLERIKELLDRENLSYGSFADEIGVQRSSLSHILNGRNNPSLDFVIKTLQRFPALNSEWFLLGKGPMYMPSAENTLVDNETNMDQDLFSSMITKPASADEKKETELFSEIPLNEELTASKPERYVSQILIFYSDSTYQVYKPEN